MKAFWQKRKWGMKVSCGGNHDNFNYSCNCWTESALYNIIQRGSDTPQRADSGKSNHTCSIQHALDTRVTADVVSSVALQRGSIQSSLHGYTFAFSSGVRTRMLFTSRVVVKGNYSSTPMIRKEAVVGV